MRRNCKNWRTRAQFRGDISATICPIATEQTRVWRESSRQSNGMSLLGLPRGTCDVNSTSENNMPLFDILICTGTRRLWDMNADWKLRLWYKNRFRYSIKILNGTEYLYFFSPRSPHEAGCCRGNQYFLRTARNEKYGFGQATPPAKQPFSPLHSINHATLIE